MHLRYIKIVISIVAIAKAMTTQADAFQLPTDEQVSGIVTLCSLGVSQNIAGDLKGAINLWRRDATVSGQASIEKLGGVLARLPAGQQLSTELYAEIRKCIRDEIKEFMNSSKAQCNELFHNCENELRVVYDGCMTESKRRCVDQCVFHYGYNRDDCTFQFCDTTLNPNVGAVNLRTWGDICKGGRDYLNKKSLCYRRYNDCLSGG